VILHRLGIRVFVGFRDRERERCMSEIRCACAVFLEHFNVDSVGTWGGAATKGEKFSDLLMIGNIEDEI